MNVYGQSKLDGELAVANTLDKFFIVRIAWVFGLNGKNFIKTMINVGKTHDTVRVVNDQIGTPTYTLDLARLLVDMIETEKYGYYHATNEGGYIVVRQIRWWFIRHIIWWRFLTWHTRISNYLMLFRHFIWIQSPLRQII